MMFETWLFGVRSPKGGNLILVHEVSMNHRLLMNPPLVIQTSHDSSSTVCHILPPRGDVLPGLSTALNSSGRRNVPSWMHKTCGKKGSALLAETDWGPEMVRSLINSPTQIHRMAILSWRRFDFEALDLGRLHFQTNQTCQ